MGRYRRVHAPHGFYYIRLKVNAGQALFHSAQDIAELNHLIANALELCDARLHAFCFVREEARLALQVAQVPAGQFVQLIAGQYSRRLHRRLGQSGGLFQRHRAVLILSERYLLKLVRYIHWTPVQMGLIADPDDYSWSSHRTYLGRAKQSWVTTLLVRKLLSRGDTGSQRAYQHWMRQGRRDPEQLVFERATYCVPAQLSPRDWQQSTGARPPRHELPSVSLDHIIDAVATKVGVSRAELVSPSRRHIATLARALVTWHAVRSGVGTMKDVAKALSRDPSTLTVAVHRYRQSKAHLFNEPL